MAIKPKKEIPAGFAFGRQNYILMGAGAVIILIGFLLMIGGNTDDPADFNADELYSFRRITLAPIVVLIGFVVEVFAIFIKKSGLLGSEPEGKN